MNNERAAKRIARERSGGICERCGQARAASFHHRKKRGQGGPWCPTNGGDLCGDGTRGCHGWVEAHPDAAWDEGWHVRPWEDPAERPVTHYQWGEVFLTEDGSYRREGYEAA